jgi:nicotinamidase-related amidase
MPNPYSVTFTTTGAKTPNLPDFSQSPFNLSVGVILLAGATATYGVEFTMDDVNDATITPVWLPDANLPAGQAASGVTNYMFPVRGIRVNIAAVTGAGLRFVVLQGTQQP